MITIIGYYEAKYTELLKAYDNALLKSYAMQNTYYAAYYRRLLNRLGAEIQQCHSMILADSEPQCDWCRDIASLEPVGKYQLCSHCATEARE